MSTGLFSAASGIRANQLKLNVISNNIANVNTLGFKSSGVNFATVFASTISGGSAPNGMLGGTNPMQVGSGTTLSDISSNWSQGGTQYTGRMSDLMINGNGFFVVERNDTNNGNNSTDYFLTRAGNFSLDSDGNLTTASGNRVRGTSQVSGSIPDTLGRIQIPIKFTIAKDYDASGKVIATHVATPEMTKADINAEMVAGAANQVIAAVELKSYTIGADGSISATYSNGDTITVRNNQATVTANPEDPTKWRTEIVLKAYEGGTFASSNVTSTDAGGLDQIGTNAVFDGGVGMGITGDGMEGMQLRIQTASVVNPAGLLYDGNNNYLMGANAGDAQFGSAASGTRGNIASGTLESSNVDISAEFTNMIVAQRGLDAASRMIRTQSEIMQTLIQMV